MHTTDVREPHCPITRLYAPIGYAAIAPAPLHVGACETQPWRLCTAPIAIIRETEHSDYTGGPVQMSNYRVLRAAFPTLIAIIGPHGYRALAYDAALGPIPAEADLDAVLESIERDPLLDAEDCAALERELEEGAWTAGGAAEFAVALAQLADDYLDPGHAHVVPDLADPAPPAVQLAISAARGHDHTTWDDVLCSLWRAGCERLHVAGGDGRDIEPGAVVFFHLDDWIQLAARRPRDPILVGVLATVAAALREGAS